MNITVEPGRYIVAVSGGVDSVALLHALVEKYCSGETKKNNRRFTVAHFDHGIREDSDKDRGFVQHLAQQYGLPFVYETGKLGPGVSEDEARKARYTFLYSVKDASRAHAIIAAHHVDDALETALFNLLRGTGRKGLSALHHNPHIIRPLLHLSKKEVIRYAKANNLQWREDITNRDTTYSRNYIRHRVIPNIPREHIEMLHEHINRAKQLNEAIDAQSVNFLHLQPSAHQISRKGFAQLPHMVAKEVLAHWLRVNEIRDFNKKSIERLTVAIKAARPNTKHAITKHFFVELQADHTAIIRSDYKKH